MKIVQNKQQKTLLVTVLNELNNQKVIAYPTEAVFGLGCNPDSESAVHTLYNLKQRSYNKGLILVAAKYEQLLPYIDDTKLSDTRLQQMFSYKYKPVTWVMPIKRTTPKWLIGSFSTIAVRVSYHPVVQILCEQFGKPLVSTSANINGLKPCRTAQEVRLHFGYNLNMLDLTIGHNLYPSEIRDALTNKLFRK
ncbi:Threonylcarbamoyl-AMP synthase [Candidatus Profftia lariciata]|uniref:Sua5/YciO/YrdC/YwlC family protein n=1 Tax=Candidatus Profftia lariciata TaxID=1987921 RepID=UPI001D00848D|nr:Sua5/YciO/YrdC/YwlC family protein [Candidatus Profftia lariciata]UDG81416.1 Threonylcarbamoyl-AMP synthase [Candidatus Profftia lariciata]